MDDVIKLIGYGEPTFDDYGNETIPTVERQVFCKVHSVGRNEFYQAAQNNLHPQYIFTISHFRDYHGEQLIKYTDWAGAEKVYTILRTYRTGDELEITAEERIGGGN